MPGEQSHGQEFRHQVGPDAEAEVIAAPMLDTLQVRLKRISADLKAIPCPGNVMIAESRIRRAPL
jgi:hypothetical protein